ncbi:MAG TPA: antitoxin Xre/MbcA/ParS toxin-binding domain-containing protein [Phnomibacter sp.]|nr:antitoxin Xre/MbcA/ParS toxin-binding domain-containing protein [Phnomibacter sp.]
MKQVITRIKPFDTKKSLQKATQKGSERKSWVLRSEDRLYAWDNNMGRVNIIRTGVPYSSIEEISLKMNRPIKAILSLVGIAQTTYNKKRSENAIMDKRGSESIVMLTELIGHGMDVFNNETEKFQRWLKKPNISLGGNSPESMLDTATGIQEVFNCLNRIEFGNMA